MTEQTEHTEPLVIGGHPLPDGWSLQDAMDFLARKVAASTRPEEVTDRERDLDNLLGWCDYLLEETRRPSFVALLPGVVALRDTVLRARHDPAVQVDDLVRQVNQHLALLQEWRENGWRSW